MRVVYLISSLQIAIFIGLWIYYSTNSLYKCPCKRYNQSFPIAKSSGTLSFFALYYHLVIYGNVYVIFHRIHFDVFTFYIFSG